MSWRRSKELNILNSNPTKEQIMPETTLKTTHIERTALAHERGFASVDSRRAAAIMRELAAERDAMQKQLQQMCKYAKWQVNEGIGHHPTLGSALAKAEAVLTAAK